MRVETYFFTKVFSVECSVHGWIREGGVVFFEKREWVIGGMYHLFCTKDKLRLVVSRIVISRVPFEECIFHLFTVNS